MAAVAMQAVSNLINRLIIQIAMICSSNCPSSFSSASRSLVLQASEPRRPKVGLMAISARNLFTFSAGRREVACPSILEMNGIFAVSEPLEVEAGETDARAAAEVRAGAVGAEDGFVGQDGEVRVAAATWAGVNDFFDGPGV